MKNTLFILAILTFCSYSALADISLPTPDSLPDVEDLPTIEELPDPFTMLDGTRIETPEQWYKYRRPELKLLFQHYMYGYRPENIQITVTITQSGTKVLDGKAILKEVEISFKQLKSPDAPKIHLALFIPNQGDGPFPVFLGLNKCGNQTVIPDESVTVSKAWQHSNCGDSENHGRGQKTDFWCVEDLVERGYAFATFHESNVDPDKHDFTDGIHPHFPNLPGPDESRWGTISAWAWGLQRCVDYLVKDTDIDNGRICLIGHSRRGKTALLAGAFDERVSLVVPHQSGTGGCALSRNNNQETVERINRVFPHWFNDTFTKFNDNEEQLPIDQHLLMALVAPRALLDTAGLQDTWANYESALRAIKAADSVWEFLGVPGMVGDGIIQEDETITAENSGDLQQYRRDSRHTLNIGYWNKILDFADVYFEKRDDRPPRRVSAAYPTVGGFERVDPAFDELVPPDTKIERLAQGFDWSEGPVWVKDGGYLLFSDIPPNTIYKWKEGHGLSLYLKPSGYTSDIERGGEVGSNGLLIDTKGRLVLCQHGDRRMARMDAPLSDPAPKFTTLAAKYNGKRFNSPNDATFHKNGDLFFTDPPYGLEKNVNDPTKELDFQGVYRLSTNGEVTLVSDKLSRPNGIAFSPDYKTLYVANSDGRNPIWMAFNVNENGKTDEGRVFFDARTLKSQRRGGGDGMKVDSQGNLFATGPGGVLVISPQGKHLGTILTGKPTSNCAFGKDGKTLYITADNYLLRVRLNTKGMGF